MRESREMGTGRRRVEAEESGWSILTRWEDDEGRFCDEVRS